MSRVIINRYAQARKSPLGSGKRFAAVKAAAAEGGAKNPDAVAAAAGMRKWGKSKMGQMAAAGRKRSFGRGGIM